VNCQHPKAGIREKRKGERRRIRFIPPSILCPLAFPLTARINVHISFRMTIIQSSAELKNFWRSNVIEGFKFVAIVEEFICCFVDDN
jgi:hypothetical protein